MLNFDLVITSHIPTQVHLIGAHPLQNGQMNPEVKWVMGKSIFTGTSQEESCASLGCICHNGDCDHLSFVWLKSEFFTWNYGKNFTSLYI